MSKNIAIIGGGNLGASIADGLLRSGICMPQQLSITRRTVAPLKRFAEAGCFVSYDNAAAIKRGEVIILAVKPYNYTDILKEINPALNAQQHLLVSVITSISIGQLVQSIEKDVAVVRAMPNTAIAIQQSMTCLTHTGVSEVKLKYVEELFNHLGRTVIIDENLMDAATVLGACGTAYAMRFIRANIQGGIEIGFDAATANLIAAQTIKGAAHLLLEKGTHPEQEIDKVTTPKGCTIAGLNEMEHQGFSSSLIRGLVTSYRKINEK